MRKDYHDKPVMEWPKEERNQYCIEHGLERELLMFKSMDAESSACNRRIAFLWVLLAICFLTLLFIGFLIEYKELLAPQTLITSFIVLLSVVGALFVLFIGYLIYDAIRG